MTAPTPAGPPFRQSALTIEMAEPWARDWMLGCLADPTTQDREAWARSVAYHYGRSGSLEVTAVICALLDELHLAVAHDRQPYPTADAYERACAALEKHRARADAANAKLGEIEALEPWDEDGCGQPVIAHADVLAIIRRQA